MPRSSPRPSGLRGRFRRPGAVVALLGPDGAGKSTVVEGLREVCERTVTVLYLGRRRGGGEPVSEASPAPRAESASPAPSALRECGFLLVRALGHLRLLARGYAAARSGDIVLCDRHPIEVLAVRPRRTPTAERLERLIARRLMPKPDLLILLDAPAETMVERKREHPLELIEERRRAYLETFAPWGAELVSTVGPAERSVERAAALVGEALRARGASRPA